MAGEPHKIRQHRERGRVLALSHLFDPDPEKPGEICEASRLAPLPEELSCRAEAARELARFLRSDFADVRRLAASALGKMAPEKPAAQTFLLSLAEFLEREGIAFVYDERFRIAEGEVVRPDFYLPEFDLYIEYFGMDTPDYLARAEKKRILYQRAGKKLISLSFLDDAHLIDTLREKLSHHFRIGGDGSRASLVPPSPAPRNQSPSQDLRNELPSRAERNERSE